MSINISRHFMWFFGFPVQLLFCIWPLSILQTVLGFGITAQSTAWHERQHDTSMHSQCIMKGNERADRLACKAAITSGLHLRRSEMLRSLRHCLWVQTKDITPSVAWRRETKSRSSLKREKSCHYSDQHLNCFKSDTRVTPGRARMDFPKHVGTILKWTELLWGVWRGEMG